VNRLRTDPLPPEGNLEEAAGLAAGISTVRRVETGELWVALTFDDGPDGTYTPAKLATLSNYGAAATFFVLGEQVDRLPDVTRQILSAGGEIGNHSYDHAYLTGLGYSGVYSELERTRQAIQGATGSPGTDLFRPPYGAYNSTVLSAAADTGYHYNVLWDVDPFDHRSPPAWVIADRVLSGVRPGSIVLLHDWVRQTAEALPTILSGLASRGYRAVKVSTLLGASPPVPPTPGPPYHPSECRVLQVQTPYMRGGDVTAVQNALGDRGYDPGPVDGVYGSQTAAAVRRFQAVQGLPVTGVVAGNEYRRLGIECPSYPPGPTPPVPPGPEPSQCRVLQVQTPLQRGDDVLAVQETLTARGFDPGPLDSVYGSRTAAAVRRFQAAQGLPVTGVVAGNEYRRLGIECPSYPPEPTPPPGPDECRTLRVTTPYMRGEDVLAVQQALQEQGIDPGPIDGIYGPLTARAVTVFQTRRGLTPNGVVTGEVYRLLGIRCP